ncbi:AlpA family phage regulatory protein [Halarcobacter sp.]|uniref:helix-turn-helix transcriptional regulator n=1 Tax=Halarcobacter sp. TaxID=2321133 RepID=UPI0029F5627E|nr:AlpA family phage regulatory protein [Halarcobacter sp.]
MSNFLRITEVMKMTGIAKSTIWLWVKEEKFPKPIKLSPRITVWDEDSINEWKKEIQC